MSVSVAASAAVGGFARWGNDDFLLFESVSLDELLFLFLLSIRRDLRRPPSSGAGVVAGEG